MSIYRHKDVVSQVGMPAFATWNFGYFGGQIIGVAVAQAVGAEAGAGAGFGVFVVFTALAILIAKTPDADTPKFFAKNNLLRKFYWLAYYSVSAVVDTYTLLAPWHGLILAGQSTATRSQCCRRHRQELEDPCFLGSSSPVHLEPDSFHRLQLLLPGV